MKRAIFAIILSFVLILVGCRNEQSPEVSEGTPAQVTTIVNIGSDTLVNLALAWAEEYHYLLPNVEISVTGGGSGTGIAALINGTVDIANASRKLDQRKLLKL
jgi:phosphate transport system substrate-binding protein